MEPVSSFADQPADYLAMDLAPAGTYSSLRKAEEHGLVVLAMALPYWVQRNGPDFSLYVPSENAAKVEEELRDYEEEQIVWNRQLSFAKAIPEYPSGVFMPYLYVLLLVAGYWIQLRWDPWIVDHGANSARHFVEEHQWWRPITALFLHGDWLHLVGNAAIGLAFGIALASSVGPRLGWLLMLAAGILGNTATTLMRPIESVPAIGASTAVFGALGALTAYGVVMAYRMRRFLHHNLVSKLVPLAFGLTILTLRGFGGGNTDVLAHVNGFAAGILIGILAGIFQKPTTTREAP